MQSYFVSIKKYLLVVEKKKSRTDFLIGKIGCSLAWQMFSSGSLAIYLNTIIYFLLRLPETFLEMTAQMTSKLNILYSYKFHI